MNNLTLLNFDNLLIIRLSSMGDVALTTYTVRSIKKNYPNLNIDFITLENYSEIYDYSPYIRNTYLFNKEFSTQQQFDFKNEILSKNNGKYSAVLDLQNNFRSNKLIKNLSDKIYKFKKRRLHKLSLVYFKKSIDKSGLSIPELYLKSFANLPIIDDGKGLEIWTSEDKKANIYLPYHKNKIKKDVFTIGIAPGAHFFTKRYPSEKLTRVVNILKQQISCNFVLIGGKEDFDLCEKIRKANPELISNKSGSESIMQTINIIDSCDALISNDTGVMHLAAARQVPIIAIFGSSVREFGFTPFRVRNEILEVQLNCRPCSHIGRSKCPKTHFNCMEMISPETIAQSLINIIKSSD